MKLEVDDVRVIVEMTVGAVLERIEERQRQFGGRIGFGEAEAAAALGIAPHRLRDSRLRGEVHARRIGKSYVYSVDSLRRYLEGQD